MKTKKNKKTDNLKMTTFIIVAGVTILIIFTAVFAYNFIQNKESNSYYVKVDENMSAEIKTIDIFDDLLVITTNDDAEEYCVKSTRSNPQNNALCWKKITDNKAEIHIFKYKKYYVWIKDNKGNISNYMAVNTKKKN